MHRLRGVPAVAAIAVTTALAAGCSNPDIFVESIEVTQAIQTATNSLSLVSDRGTTVRVRVGVTGGGTASGVSGRLHVNVNGSAVTPPAGIAPINAPFSAPNAASWSRDNENHTLNFELPAVSGITTSADVDVVVNLDVLAGEPDTTNNSGTVDNLTALQRILPQLYYTRIDYTPAGAGLPALADIQQGVGDMFVRGIYPVNDADANLYRQGLFPTLTWSQDGNGNGQVDSGGEVSDILDWLESCRQLIVDNSGGNGDDIFLYGWIAGNPIVGNGWAPIGGRVAFGNTEHVRHQRTYAHELGHNFGLDHNSRTLAPNTGWDTGARLANNPASNNTTGRVKPTTLSDIMRGGQLTNSAWVDEPTYTFFLDHEVLDPAGDREGDRRYTARIVAISGVLSTEGTQIVRLNPSFRYPWPSQPSLPFAGAAYIAEVIDSQGAAWNMPFSGMLGDDRDDQLVHFGFFTVRVRIPADREANVVRIRRVSGEVLREMRRTRPPTLSLGEVSTGAVLDSIVELTFTVADPDTPLGDVRVQFAYSADAGATWVPIAVNVPGTETRVSFDAAQIQNTAGNSLGVLRAFASDGLNTVMAERRGFTVRSGRPRS
ncbi:MAG: hypothetical protein M3373_09370 [Gemmatimonadota bacterium]|nr:hypothetical protein [Gemmatimonadota bacterium]